jgi:hypothetical protein
MYGNCNFAIGRGRIDPQLTKPKYTNTKGGAIKISRPIKEVNSGAVFNSSVDACHNYGITQSMVSHSIRTGKTVNGMYQFVFIDEIGQKTKEKFKVKCLETGVVYETIVLAEKENGLSNGLIRKSWQYNGAKKAKGLTFVKVDV